MKSFLLVALALSAAVAMAGCDGSSDSSAPSAPLAAHAGKTYKAELGTATPKAIPSIPKVLYFDIDDDGKDADILVLYEDNSFQEYDDVKAVSAPDGGLSFTANSELSISTNTTFSNVTVDVPSFTITGTSGEVTSARSPLDVSALKKRVQGKEYYGSSHNGSTGFAITFQADKIQCGLFSLTPPESLQLVDGKVPYNDEGRFSSKGTQTIDYSSVSFKRDCDFALSLDFMSGSVEFTIIDEDLIEVDSSDDHFDYYVFRNKQYTP